MVTAKAKRSLSSFSNRNWRGGDLSEHTIEQVPAVFKHLFESMRVGAEHFSLLTRLPLHSLAFGLSGRNRRSYKQIIERQNCEERECKGMGGDV